MKIINLKAENVKCLKAIEIKPDGSLVVIGGANGAGKTSVLDSIMYALKGKGSQPSRPVRDGQEMAEITCELDDLIITRTIGHDGVSKLVVAAKDGSFYPSPQAVLNKLTGSLAFDPLEFARQKAPEQRETVKRLLGLDFSELDRHRKAAYDSRTAENREVNKLTALIGDLPPRVDAPDAEVVVADLVQELEKRQQVNYKKGELGGEAKALVAIVKDLEIQSADLQRALITARKEAESAAAKYESAPRVDEQEIRQQIDEAQELNATIRDNHARTKLEQSLKETRLDVRNSEGVMRKIDADKAAQLKAAKWPISGMSIDGSGVLYKSLPFEQASSAEQLRISVAMGLAMNPELRVLLVRDGSLLDKNNLAMIAEMAAVADAQVWIERVGEGDECQVIIEDGMVKK